MAQWITKRSEQQLFGQHVGTGILLMKVSENEIVRVEVFQKPDGTLHRIVDGKPALPLPLTYETWDDEAG